MATGKIACEPATAEPEIVSPAEGVRPPFKLPAKPIVAIAAVAIVIILVIAMLPILGGEEEEKGAGGGGGSEGEEVMVPDDYDETFSDSLQHGRILVSGGVPHPEGQGEGETYNLYDIEVKSNNSEIRVESSGNGGRPRWDTGDSNDIDLYLYKPGKDAGGDFEGTNPDDQAATPYINEILEHNPKEVGNYTLRVDCYTSENGNPMQYTVHIQVLYEQGSENETNGGRPEFEEKSTIQAPLYNVVIIPGLPSETNFFTAEALYKE